MNFEIGPYDLCPCGSGTKYKFCCAAKAKYNRHGKFPIGTVAYYGPDDQTTTKIAAGVFLSDGASPILERWNGDNVASDAKVADDVKRFFASHGVKTVVATNGNLGCPHEEGIDFPRGHDCPFCPFWMGMQGTARRDDADELFATAATYNKSELLAQLSFQLPKALDESEHENVTQKAWDDEDLDDDQSDEDVLAEDDWDEEQDEKDQIARRVNFEEAMKRVQAILGDQDLTFEETLIRLAENIQSNLQLPCELTGLEDFRWEEKYVIGGWSRKEYKKLKQIQPSYSDHYEFLSFQPGEWSEWMMFDDDIAVHVRRISDGREFVLGLAELEVTDKASPNYKLVNDYAGYFVNNR